MTVSIQPVLNCVQYKCSDNRTPLLPPDSQWCVQKGSSKIIDYDIITEARDAYRYGMEMSRNKYNLRKYLRGGVYRNIFKEKCNMIDVRDYGGRLDLNIKISENEYSIFKIRDISHHSLALRKIKRFNERCSKESIVRGQSGDLGSMFAFGLFNKKAGDYVSMKKNSENVREYQIAARKLLDGFFSDEIDEIIEESMTDFYIMNEIEVMEDVCSTEFLENLPAGAQSEIATNTAASENHVKAKKANFFDEVIGNSAEITRDHLVQLVLKLDNDNKTLVKNSEKEKEES